jgi:hypothetical protein
MERPGFSVTTVRTGLGEYIRLIGLIVAAIVVAFLVLVVVSSSIRTARECKEGAAFRLGRLIGLKGPGLYLSLRRRSTRQGRSPRDHTGGFAVGGDHRRQRDCQDQHRHLLPGDRHLYGHHARLQLPHGDPQIAQTTLRTMLGQSSPDEFLGQRDKMNQTLQAIIDRHTESWSIKVTAVEAKDAELASTMVRALAKQAEVKRVRSRPRSSPPRASFRPPDPGQRCPGDLDPACCPGPAPHADPVRRGLKPACSRHLPIPIELIRPLLAAPVEMDGLAVRGRRPRD